MAREACLEAELRHAHKLETIGRLAGGIAHDFNNLLTAIGGYGESLKQGLAPEDPLHEDAVQITRAAELAGDLTRRLLAFSHRQEVAPRVLDLSEVVHETAPMLRRLIGQEIEFVISLDAQPVAVRADPGELEQVVVNLAVNARDAMPGEAAWRYAPRSRNRRRSSSSPTPGPGWARTRRRASSSRSSPPRSSAGAPGWACRPSTGSSSATAGV